MPTYKYKCQSCDITFEKFHSMSETVEKCVQCESSVTRVPSLNYNLKKTSSRSKTKPGSVVREYIKDAKEDLKQQKRDIRGKEIEKK